MLSNEIWYSQKIGNLFHIIFKENSMLGPRTCHFLTILALFCTGITHSGTNIVVAYVVELGRLQ